MSATTGGEATGGEPPLVLAIDIGSTSIKAAVYDARGRLVPRSLRRYRTPLAATDDGGMESDAEALRRRVEAAVTASLGRIGPAAREVRAVGLDTMAASLVGVDAAGRAVTPVFAYADTRAREDARALRRELDAEAVHQRTGCPIHTAYYPALLRWLLRTRPEPAQRVARWMDIGTFLYRQWFGDTGPMSYSMASWTGLLDRRRLVWDEGLLKHLGVPVERLPTLADYTEARRGLARRYARRWPALADAAFCLAVGDGAAANIGSGCTGADRIALTIGGSAALRVLLPTDVDRVPEGMWVYRVGADESLLGGSFSAGGNVFAWARNALRLPAAGRLERELAALPPDGHGVSVLPFLAGERSPGWALDAAGAVLGLRLATSPMEVLQALLEGMSYRMAPVAAALRRHAGPGAQIVASGGAITGSPYWLQVMADVLGGPVTVCKEPEATGRGAALLALGVTGDEPRATTDKERAARDGVVSRMLPGEPAALGETYEPDAQRGAVYRAAMERQQMLYERVMTSE